MSSPMVSDRFITLAIHTYERANEIKNILEQEGVGVELNNVNLSTPEISSGVRVRIRETDLPKALLIVENFDIFKDNDHNGNSPSILVPTDFSRRSFTAARIAMEIAQTFKADVTFLNAYFNTLHKEHIQLAEVYKYDTTDKNTTHKCREEANKQMQHFLTEIKKEIKNGELSPVKFTHCIQEGIPEEVILNYTGQHHPPMVVMTTREAQKKETELIGSVSAEVLDGCRVPVLTIPENLNISSLNHISHIVFLSTFDQEDLIAIDSLFRIWPVNDLHVTVLGVPPRRFRDAPQQESTQQILKYCTKHYPDITFSAETVSTHAVSEFLDKAFVDNPFQLLCIPNKHKNVVSRIFNPSLAHKLLFRADIPMLVLPV